MVLSMEGHYLPAALTLRRLPGPGCRERRIIVTFAMQTGEACDGQ